MESSQQKLWAAIERGDADAVIIKVLDVLSEANAIDESSKQKLWDAAEQGDADALIGAHNALSKVNAIDKNHMTALMLASNSGHLKCVEALLQRGADVNYKDETGTTALMKASERGHIKCVVALLQWGDDQVNMWNDSGSTALMNASHGGHIECVEALLQAKADVNPFDNVTKTALMYATMNGHTKCVEALLLGGAPEDYVEEGEGKTALDLASDNNHSKIVELLQSAKANRPKHPSKFFFDHTSQNEVVEPLNNPSSAVTHEGGKPQNKACKGGLRSSEFRTAGCNKNYIYVYDGTLGVIETVGKGSEVPPGEEVDHIIELGIVSEAFCKAFEEVKLETCLEAMCEINKIVNNEHNLCRVSKFLNRTKNKKWKSVAVLTYMKETKEYIVKCIEDIKKIKSPQIETFAKNLVQLLNEAYQLNLQQT